MPRFRSRGDICRRCHGGMSITANLDLGAVTTVRLPDQCLNTQNCHERLAHDILDAPFDEGKKSWT